MMRAHGVGLGNANFNLRAHMHATHRVCACVCVYVCVCVCVCVTHTSTYPLTSKHEASSSHTLHLKKEKKINHNAFKTQPQVRN